MLNDKTPINSTISDAHNGARHLGLDVKNCCLGTPMTFLQHIHIPPSIIPQEVWDDTRHNICIALTAASVSKSAARGMQGLKEAGIIASNQIVKKLTPSSNEPMPLNPGLWRHGTKCTAVVLCVDDFGVKHFSKPDAMHLINAIKAHCDLTVDWSGELCCMMPQVKQRSLR
jgi:hypothetical protein